MAFDSVGAVSSAHRKLWSGFDKIRCTNRRVAGSFSTNNTLMGVVSVSISFRFYDFQAWRWHFDSS